MNSFSSPHKKSLLKDLNPYTQAPPSRKDAPKSSSEEESNIILPIVVENTNVAVSPSPLILVHENSEISKRLVTESNQSLFNLNLTTESREFSKLNVTHNIEANGINHTVLEVNMTVMEKQNEPLKTPKPSCWDYKTCMNDSEGASVVIHSHSRS